MPDLKILDYATQRSVKATTAVTDAQQHLAAAQAAFTAKRDELATATAAFVELEKTAAEIRKKLGVIPTPVDGPTLLHKLEQVIIGSRARQAAILKAGSDLRAAQSDADQAQAELAAASASRAKADSDLLQAKQSDSLRNGWKKALTEEPLSTINAHADDALKDKDAELKDTPFKKAKTRVESELPKILRDRAIERRTAEADRFAGALESVQLAEDRLLTERGAAGAVENTGIRLLRAEAAAKDFVNKAKSGFEQAQTLLDLVTGSSSKLTDDQRTGLNDSSLATARGDAASTEAVLDGLKNDVEVAQAELDQVRLDAIVDPDTDVAAALKTRDDAKLAFEAEDKVWRAEFDLAVIRALEAEVEAKRAALQKLIDAGGVDADPAVVPAKQEWEEAKKALKIANPPYFHSLLNAWEAAAPDAIWRLLDDFLNAQAVLTLLRDSHPDTLATGLTTAETNYVTALLAADASAAVLNKLAAEQARRAALQQSAQQAESNSLFSALRGDN